MTLEEDLNKMKLRGLVFNVPCVPEAWELEGDDGTIKRLQRFFQI